MSDIPPTEPTAETRTPIEVEVLGDDVVQVSYGDQIYVLPASIEDADDTVLEAIDDQKLSYVIRHLLGPDQLKKFKATKPKIRDYKDLFETYAKQIGLGTAGD